MSSSSPHNLLVRTLYRHFLRVSRTFDRAPLMKAVLRRPRPSASVPKPPQVTLLVADDKVIPIVTANQPSNEAPPPPSIQDRIADSVWSDAFSSSESQFYRPSVKFTNVARKWFREMPFLKDEPNTTPAQLLEAGFSVYRDLTIQAAAVKDSKLLEQAQRKQVLSDAPASPPAVPTDPTLAPATPAATASLWAKPTDPSDLQSGMCLISHPAFTYPYFNRTVILLTQQHPSGGWRGVILNKLFPWQVASSDVFRNGPPPSARSSDPLANAVKAEKPIAASEPAAKATTDSTSRRNMGRRGRPREPVQDLVRSLFASSPLRFGGPVPSGLQYLHRYVPSEAAATPVLPTSSSTDATPSELPSDANGFNTVKVPLTQEEEEAAAANDALELDTPGIDGMTDSLRVTDSVYWGVDSQLESFLRFVRKSAPSITSPTSALSKTEVQAVNAAAKQFIWVAYESSWSPGQLERELRQGYFFTAQLSDDLLFSRVTSAREGDGLWETTLRLMGDEYASISTFPAELEAPAAEQQGSVNVPTGPAAGSQ